MTITHIKSADGTRGVGGASEEVRAQVRQMLALLRDGGEAAATKMAQEYDGWTGPVVMDRAAIVAATRSLAPSLIEDIGTAHGNIRTFAEAQRRSLEPFELEVAPGLVAGQRLVPVSVAGCYVPAGRFAHIASALMSVTTSSVAGVETVIVASPARPDRGGVHPAIVHAADLAGADIILGLGGVQAIGALAEGLFTGLPADMIVGPGNALVAEAKRQLFGQVGIDVVAGPTESMIVADHTADPHRVATDLVGQAEHGADSPVWLVTTSAELARSVADLVPRLADALPEPARTSALDAWAQHGEIMLTETDEEAAAVCDDYAAEHLQVMTANLDWWHQRLRHYGSLFLGHQASVTFGDKSAGPNHILPTGRAARYTGGLNVLKFLRQLTYQQLTDAAASEQGALAARISRYEGMEGHARSADLRAAVDGPTSQDTAASSSPHGLPHVTLDFTAQEALPAAAVKRANELMATGRLFRYGESEAGEADAAALEDEFASMIGRRYCVALNSCGAAMAVALMAAGLERDEPVLMNAFTLAPVPGAIAHAGARPVFVGITPELHIDLDDLTAEVERSGSRWLLLSYMRGHIPNMDDVMALCDRLGVTVIEDCAHTMGAGWRGRLTGTFGLAGCFSTQSFKHANSGEGGLLVTDDEDLAAKAILLSGSYMLYEQHGARPPAEVFEKHRLNMPNLSMRMSAFAAALVRPQLPLVAERAGRWNRRYRQLDALLSADPRITVPIRSEDESYVASSIQFRVESDRMDVVVRIASDHGVHVKWFGAAEPAGFTSTYEHWRYASETERPLTQTSNVLRGLCDLRIPLAMTEAEAADVAAVVRGAITLADSGG